MKKAFRSYLFLVCFLTCGSSFAQPSVFPKWGLFADLEKLVGKDLVAIQEKEKTQPLTREELITYLNISLQAKKLMDLQWQAEYAGFVKRVEAQVLFNAAIMISHQPGFYRDTTLTSRALEYIDAGYKALATYSPSHIIVNIETDQARGTRSTSKKTVYVDETAVKNLRVKIAEANGNYAIALEDLYNLWGDNKQIFNIGNHDEDFSFATAHQILRYSRLQSRYDQKFHYFCMSLLEYNTSNTPTGSYRTGADLPKWNSLKKDILETLDIMIGQLDSSKKFNFHFPEPNVYHREYDWLLSIICRFDDKNALGEISADFAFMNYAMDIANTETGTEVSRQSEQYAKKHFMDYVVNLHGWKEMSWRKYRRAQWIEANMVKYPIPEDEQKFIAKLIKKGKRLKE